MILQYTVKKGDSLSSIASAHGISLSELRKANPHFWQSPRNPDLIYPGEKISIPDKPTKANGAPPKPSKSGAGTCPPGSTKVSCPCSGAKITSETIAASPSNRTRIKIGVGEEVKLTYSKGNATWKIIPSVSGTLSPASGSQTTFTAKDIAGIVIITATGGGCSATITFAIVTPSGWTMTPKRKSKSKLLKHTHGRPDCGWKGIMYVHPNDVNFYNVETREKDSIYVGTGSYSSYNGSYHGDYPPPDRVSAWFPIIRHSETDGSTDDAPDAIYTGLPSVTQTGATPPFKVGSGYFPIVIQWRVVGSTTIHDFSTVRQEDEIFADGRCESRKGGHTEHTMYNDPASTY